MTVVSPPLLRGDGASAQNRRSTRLATPLGDMLVAVSDDGVLGAYFDGQAHQPDAAWFGARVEQRDDALLDAAAQQLTAWFAGERTDFDLPLAPLGTPFQRSVWELLLRIPPGETTTYGELSASLSPDGVATPGQAQGRRAGRRPQPGQRHRAVPPRRRLGRFPRRLRRRPGSQTLAPRPRGERDDP